MWPYSCVKLQDAAATAAAAQAKKTDAPQADDEEGNEPTGNEDASEGDEDSSAAAAATAEVEGNKTDSAKSASPKKNKKSDLDVNEQVSDEPTQTEVRHKIHLQYFTLYLQYWCSFYLCTQESNTKSTRKRNVRKD